MTLFKTPIKTQNIRRRKNDAGNPSDLVIELFPKGIPALTPEQMAAISANARNPNLKRGFAEIPDPDA